MQVIADRLYGLSFRPQELALHGESVQVQLRYSPIFDDAAACTERHFSLLVLEMWAEPTPGERLELIRIGWELERLSPTPVAAGSVFESLAEVPLLLDRIAVTINELAHKAGLPPALGPEAVTTLLHRYRLGAKPGV